METHDFLTPAELNAAFFVGLKAGRNGASCSTLCDYIKLGVTTLWRCGYHFVYAENVGPDDVQGLLAKVAAIGDVVLADRLGLGPWFDVSARAREAVEFLRAHVPGYAGAGFIAKIASIHAAPGRG